MPIKFHIVKFLDEVGYSEIIHDSWLLNDNLSYWPNQNDPVDKYRLTGYLNKEWMKVRVKIIYSSVDYSEACRKFKLYLQNGTTEVESDIESDVEKKRSRKRRKKLFTSDSEDENTYSSSKISFPTFKRQEPAEKPVQDLKSQPYRAKSPAMLLKYPRSFESSTSNLDISSPTNKSCDLSNNLAIQSPLSSVINRTFDSAGANSNQPRSSAMLLKYPHSLESSTSNLDISSPTNKSCDLSNNLAIQSPLSSVINRTSDSAGANSNQRLSSETLSGRYHHIGQTSDLVKTFMGIAEEQRLQRILISEMRDALHMQIQNVAVEVKEIRKKQINLDHEDVNLMEYFPITTKEQFLTVKEKLNEEATKKSLVKIVALKSGKQQETIVANCIKELLDDSFTLSCNFTGLNNKIGIDKSWVHRLIYAVLIQNNISLSCNEIKLHIQQYLKKTADSLFQKRRRARVSVDIENHTQPGGENHTQPRGENHAQPGGENHTQPGGENHTQPERES